MGSCIDASICEKKENLKETWKFNGNIILNNNSIVLPKLKGKINILEANNVKEIQAEGKANSKNKFKIKGKELHNNNKEKDPKKTTFQIIGENKNYPKEVIFIKEDEQKAKIESEFEYKNYGLCKLSLSLDLKKNEKENLNENTKFRFSINRRTN